MPDKRATIPQANPSLHKPVVKANRRCAAEILKLPLRLRNIRSMPPALYSRPSHRRAALITGSSPVEIAASPRADACRDHARTGIRWRLIRGSTTSILGSRLTASRRPMPEIRGLGPGHLAPPPIPPGREQHSGMTRLGHRFDPSPSYPGICPRRAVANRGRFRS